MGGWWDLGGGAMRNKMAIEGGEGHPKNIREKRGDQEKYLSKTLKWHDVFILKKLAED